MWGQSGKILNIEYGKITLRAYYLHIHTANSQQNPVRIRETYETNVSFPERRQECRHFRCGQTFYGHFAVQKIITEVEGETYPHLTRIITISSNVNY